MIDIFDYSDYRQYLKDVYAQNKAVNYRYSFRYLALKAGIGSPSYYKHVMDGKRNLTRDTAMKTCLALQLKAREAEYFENLVLFNQAKTIKDKNQYFDQLIRLQKNRNVKKVDKEQYEYYAAWYHPIVRELVVMADFGDDYKRLAAMLTPPINASQAEYSVKMLLRLGFIKKNHDGTYTQTDPVITSGNNFTAHKIIQYQIAMLRQAQEAYERKANRIMSSTTFGLSKDTFNLFTKKLRELRSQLLEVARLEENPTKVFQLNVNLFSVSKEVAGK